MIRNRGPIVLLVAALSAAAATALAAGAAAPAQAAGSRAAAQQPLSTTAPPAGMPAGVPPAATAAEPTLPAPSTTVWPFGETWSRTEGSGRLADGASFWTDYVYDDHGAGEDGLPIGADSLISTLAPTQGVYSYPAGPADGNGADVFRTAVGATADGTTYWRVDWNTLADATVPAAEWVWDDGTGTTTAPWPRNAGVSSTGVVDSLFVSNRHAYLTVGGVTTDLPTSVDLSSRSFVVKVPAGDVPVTGHIRLRMGAGLASADGTQFAAPTKPATASLPGLGVLPSLSDNLMNVTFRTYAQEPPVYTGTAVSDAVLDALATVLTTGPITQAGLDGETRFIQGNFWNDDDQADALQAGDVSAFSLSVDWSQLLARTSTPEPLPTGVTTTRWYVTPIDLGQGAVHDSGAGAGDLRPNYLGRVQPYAVYVPSGYTGSPTKLTWILHSLSVDYLQYAAYDPSLVQQLCQDRDSICATTEGFAPDMWYFDEAEADYWAVWHALATSYRLDPDRTVVGGYSMGGWAAYKLGLEHPDLYAQAYALEGPPTCGVQVVGPVRGGSGSGHCDDDGLSAPLLANARWVPYTFTAGVADELVPVTSTLEQYQALDALGYRYRFFLYPTEDHLVYATQDRFADEAATIGSGTKTVDPGHVTYAWFPDVTVPQLGIGATTAYWVGGLAARTTTGGTVATVDATSAGRPDPAVTVTRPTPTATTTPTPGLRFDLDWTTGASAPARDALALTLTDVSALTVDAPAAGLSCPTITATSDGPTTLVVTGTTAGTRTYVLPAGASTIASCTATAAVPTSGAVVPPAGGSKPAGSTSAGAPGLAVTGGSAAAPVVATVLVVAASVAVIGRRRRTATDRDQ